MISWLLGIHTSYTTDTLYKLYSIIFESLYFTVLSTHISCQRFSIIYTEVIWLSKSFIDLQTHNLIYTFQYFVHIMS